MDGMREAHEEYPNPEIKKNMLAALLNCAGDFLFGISGIYSFYKIGGWPSYAKASAGKHWWLTLVAGHFCGLTPGYEH
jgi:hypothetical protein